MKLLSLSPPRFRSHPALIFEHYFLFIQMVFFFLLFSHEPPIPSRWFVKTYFLWSFVFFTSPVRVDIGPLSELPHFLALLFPPFFYSFGGTLVNWNGTLSFSPPLPVGGSISPVLLFFPSLPSFSHGSELIREGRRDYSRSPPVLTRGGQVLTIFLGYPFSSVSETACGCRFFSWYVLVSLLLRPSS